MTKWYISKEEDVSGPFSTKEVQKEVNDGHVIGEHHIWSRRLSDWRTISWWLKELPNLAELDKKEEAAIWHYAISDASHGPMTKSQMIADLKGHPLKKNAHLWTPGMKRWTPIFEFYDVLDEIDVNRRQHLRADVTGKVVIRIEDQTYIGKLTTISEGGLGAAKLPQLSSGQLVKVELISDSLPSHINAKAIVQYVTKKGTVGLKFEHLHMEAKSTIIEYVKGTIAEEAA